jgi:hypothetical protein
VMFLILENTDRYSAFPYTSKAVHNAKQAARPSSF